jgi:hypothetical protein
MSKFIVTLRKKVSVSEGDVIDDFLYLNASYVNPLTLRNFDFRFFINNDGSYGEIHGNYIGSSNFNEWILTEEVRNSMSTYEQPRLDFMKDSIEITRYLDWDDTGISTNWKLFSEFISTTELTSKLV